MPYDRDYYEEVKDGHIVLKKEHGDDGLRICGPRPENEFSWEGHVGRAIKELDWRLREVSCAECRWQVTLFLYRKLKDTMSGSRW